MGTPFTRPFAPVPRPTPADHRRDGSAGAFCAQLPRAWSVPHRFANWSETRRASIPLLAGLLLHHHRARSYFAICIIGVHDGVKLVLHEAAPTVAVTFTLNSTVAPEMLKVIVALPLESVAPVS